MEIEYLTGERWFTACKTEGILRLMTPPRTVAIDSTMEVILTENPTWEKRVQNIIPSDSPQLVMQKALNDEINNMVTVRLTPIA